MEQAEREKDWQVILKNLEGREEVIAIEMIESVEIETAMRGDAVHLEGLSTTAVAQETIVDFKRNGPVEAPTFKIF